MSEVTKKVTIPQTRCSFLEWLLIHNTAGKYLVREEVEKAPTYDDQPCQLTQTAVKISFPEEMRSEIFVNLLGYKEPNLLHLKRSVVELLSFRIDPCY